MKDGDLIRFVTHDRHPPYGHRSSVVRAAFALWRANILEARQQEELRAILDWVNGYLSAAARIAGAVFALGSSSGNLGTGGMGLPAGAATGGLY
jgi:hypothetical protein